MEDRRQVDRAHYCNQFGKGHRCNGFQRMGCDWLAAQVGHQLVFFTEAGRCSGSQQHRGNAFSTHARRSG